MNLNILWCNRLFLCIFTSSNCVLKLWFPCLYAVEGWEKSYLLIASLGGRKWIEKKGFERIINFFHRLRAKVRKKRKDLERLHFPLYIGKLSAQSWAEKEGRHGALSEFFNMTILLSKSWYKNFKFRMSPSAYLIHIYFQKGQFCKITYLSIFSFHLFSTPKQKKTTYLLFFFKTPKQLR